MSEDAGQLVPSCHQLTEDAALVAYLDRLAGIPPRAIPHDEPGPVTIPGTALQWWRWPQVVPREQREQRKGPRASRFGDLP